MSALYVSNGNTSYAHWEITPQKVGRKTLYELSSELTLLSIRVCSVNNSILIMGKGLTEVKALSLFTYAQLLFNRVFFSGGYRSIVGIQKSSVGRSFFKSYIVSK